MITKKTWKEFRKTGLLWWINAQLHVFGWSIIYDFGEDGGLKEVYPARVKFRGFDELTNTTGFINVNRYLKENILELDKEANE